MHVLHLRRGLMPNVNVSHDLISVICDDGQKVLCSAQCLRATAMSGGHGCILFWTAWSFEIPWLERSSTQLAMTYDKHELRSSVWPNNKQTAEQKTNARIS